MLILKKLPQGSIYPQITQAPITNYADFLNFFRGGHTIDDNLGARTIQDTVQYTMFKIGYRQWASHEAEEHGDTRRISCGHFSNGKSDRNWVRRVFDRKFCEMAIAEARKSIAEDDGELHPYVGCGCRERWQRFSQRDTEAKREMEGTLNIVLSRKSKMMWIASI